MSGAEIQLGLLMGLSVNEICELAPWAARKLVRWSARHRYTNPVRGEARAEELAALIDDRPGKLFKLGTALGFVGFAIVAIACRTVTRHVDVVRNKIKQCRHIPRLAVALVTQGVKRASVVIPATAAIISGIAAVVRLAPRRRISYRVHHDARIGAPPDIVGVAELVVRRKNKEGKLRDVPNASLALVRVSNDGGLDIDQSDYVEPVTFTFGDRKVVSVAIMDDVTDAQRAKLLGHTHSDRQDDTQALTFSDGENWLRLPPMQLDKKERFRVLVLLSGAGTGVEASGVLKGAVRRGGLVRDTGGIGPRGTTIAFAFGLLLATVPPVVLFLLGSR